MFPRLLLLICLSVSARPLGAHAVDAPKPVEVGLSVELVAMEPDIRTPTAVAVDSRGRIWVLENNTHFRPKTYAAPPTDRVVVMEDFGPDGRARKVSTYADGFRDGMGLQLLDDGAVLVSTRHTLLRLRDQDGDGKADTRDTLLELETKADYPHNGLSGVTVSKDGLIYLGLGENHGLSWTLKGHDGATLQGSDEGGIFRCDLKGEKLERWALGLWNPYGLAFNDHGELFALDNDPGGGSLCRLLHIVRGGDYGYRYRYGRTIDHPFVSWLGQIPGTLPPICLSGEAPTGLLAHGDDLLGATWTDHGVQRFPLTARGSSYSSTPEWIVRGGNDFRPSGLAAAPDGSLVISDWVDGSYEVHGKGRIWRVRGMKVKRGSPTSTTSAPTEKASGIEDAWTFLRSAGAQTSSDPFALHQAIETLASLPDPTPVVAAGVDPNARVRLGALLAMRRASSKDGRKLLPQWLSDPEGTVRRAALQWICEENLTDLASELDRVLTGDELSRSTFLAYLATVQFLSSGKPDPSATVEKAAKIALDDARPAPLRVLALRTLPVTYAGFTPENLRAFLDSPSPELRVEVTRLLAARSDEPAQAELRRIAVEKADSPLFAEALAGLAHSAEHPETASLLEAALSSHKPAVAREAARSLNRRPTTGIPADRTAALEAGGDPDAGFRLFNHPNGPRCFTCHAIEGRGGISGPDLTQIGRMNPTQLLEAIVEPSKEVAPAYTNWLLRLKDGREVSGIDLREDSKSTVTLIDATGVVTKYKVADVIASEPLPISLMPPRLDMQMTTQDLRDLLAYMGQLRE